MLQVRAASGQEREKKMFFLSFKSAMDCKGLKCVIPWFRACPDWHFTKKTVFFLHFDDREFLDMFWQVFQDEPDSFKVDCNDEADLVNIGMKIQFLQRWSTIEGT